MDNRSEVRDFLATRRAKVTPEQAGLPMFGGHRRVAGLRREEVALLAGVSVDYYTRLERGNLAGASDSVLESLARALQLDEAERAHLFDLARAANATSATRRRPAAHRVRPSVQRILDAMSSAPAIVRNGRSDYVAANSLARALYAPVFDSPAGPPNSARFAFLDPRATDFYVDYDRTVRDLVAALRAEAGRNPYDKGPTSSASCRPAARRSGRSGHPTTSACTAPDRSDCTIRSSATSSSATRRWSCRPTRG